MRVTVFYPEHWKEHAAPIIVLEEFHDLKLLRRPDGTLHPMLMKTKTDGAVILDQRAIVYGPEVGRVLYWPRMLKPGELEPGVREWLRRHPHWAVPGCEQNWERAVSEIPG